MFHVFRILWNSNLLFVFFNLPSKIPIGVSAAGDLHFDLRPILKCKTDIFLIKNCDKVNQAVPLLFIKLRDHTVLPLEEVAG
jgi:hypothetical protein